MGRLRLYFVLGCCHLVELWKAETKLGLGRLRLSLIWGGRDSAGFGSLSSSQVLGTRLSLVLGGRELENDDRIALLFENL